MLNHRYRKPTGRPAANQEIRPTFYVAHAMLPSSVFMPYTHFDLFAAARQQMIREGFDPDFPGETGDSWGTKPDLQRHRTVAWGVRYPDLSLAVIKLMAG